MSIPELARTTPVSPPYSEKKDESNGKEHWGLQLYASTPHCCDPTKDLDPCRYSYNHGSGCKISTCVNIKPYCVHVMGPDNKSQHSNTQHRVDHP